jgi:hypothetical protein
MIVAGTSLQGCYGGFNLTRKLYNWNGTLGDKFINSGVMWLMVVVPIYEIAGFVDFAVFNVIEFWSGANPIAMRQGETETRLVRYQGEDYIVAASRNRLDLSRAKGDPRPASLVFDPAEKAWFAQTASDRRKLAEWADDEGQLLDLIKPDGSRMRVEM